MPSLSPSPSPSFSPSLSPSLSAVDGRSTAASHRGRRSQLMPPTHPSPAYPPLLTPYLRTPPLLTPLPLLLALLLAQRTWDEDGIALFDVGDDAVLRVREEGELEQVDAIDGEG